MHDIDTWLYRLASCHVYLLWLCGYNHLSLTIQNLQWCIYTFQSLIASNNLAGFDSSVLVFFYGK